jgi:hypothetical protein
MLTTDFEGGVPAGNLEGFTKQLRGSPNAYTFLKAETES